MTTERLAFDRASVRTFDKDGHLHVARANISKANICPYVGNEIPGYQELGLDAHKVYRLYRDPAELEKAAPTAAGKPILISHQPVTAGDYPAGKVIGAIDGDVEWHAPYLTAPLTIWPKEAIDLIESGKQRELSLGYRYSPDMTPGRADGQAYDGVMRKITVNHLALVEDGRAGPDVVVGDSKETLNMVDRNLAASKAKIVALAQDGKFDELKEFLDAFSGGGDPAPGPSGEENDAEPPALGGPPEKPAAPAPGEGEPEAEGGDPVEAIKKFLSGILNPEQMQQLDALVAKIGGEQHEDEEAPEAGKPEEPVTDEDPEDNPKDKDTEMVSKPAMDAAIAAAEARATARALSAAKELREAEKFVRPFVGELAVAYDSAEAVLRAAAKALKVPEADKVHASALRPMISMAQTPASKPRLVVAQDAAADSEHLKAFPNANRLKK